MASTLADMKIGDSCVVTKVNGTGDTRRHILEMGIIPRTRLSVVKFAPMGDPIEITLRGYSLTLRQHDAKKVEVERQ